MSAYYNENNAYAAQWLRNLISAGHIPAGDVDDRSIEDVSADDLKGYVQCHFFAGIGGWSYALRLAGWPDDKPVWTGSCPCQPFSTAGKGTGFEDKRHLWPAFQHLIQQCRPTVVFGEQVASKDAEPWIDLVHADMEAMGYAFGCVAFPAAGVGAPHIRDRAYWAGHAVGAGLEGCAWHGDNPAGRAKPVGSASAPSDALWMADAECQRIWPCGQGSLDGAPRTMQGEGKERQRLRAHTCTGTDRLASTQFATGPTNGFWRDVDWLGCRDGKWRPVEPGSFPLAHGVSGRVAMVRTDEQTGAEISHEYNRAGALKGFGNAIVPQVAAEVISAFMDYEMERAA